MPLKLTTALMNCFSVSDQVARIDIEIEKTLSHLFLNEKGKSNFFIKT